MVNVIIHEDCSPPKAFTIGIVKTHIIIERIVAEKFLKIFHTDRLYISWVNIEVKPPSGLLVAVYIRLEMLYVITRYKIFYTILASATVNIEIAVTAKCMAIHKVQGRALPCFVLVLSTSNPIPISVTPSNTRENNIIVPIIPAEIPILSVYKNIKNEPMTANNKLITKSPTTYP